MRVPFSLITMVLATGKRVIDPQQQASFRRWLGGGEPSRSTDLICELPSLLAARKLRRRDNGNTPLATSADGAVSLLMDGFIVNRDELVQGLPPVAGGGSTSQDAEILPLLYLKEGEEFLRRVNGWFALVILDTRDGTALVANDRFGMYPIYYRESGETLCLSTQAHTLQELIPGGVELDLKGVASYLAYGGVLAERTLFRGVRRMAPAQAWRIGNGESRRRSYFDFGTLGDGEPLTDSEEAITATAELMSRVMPRYLTGKEPLRFSLTGGWDSRTLLSFLDHSPPQILSSYYYTAHPRSSDVQLSRRVAGCKGLKHRIIPIEEDFFTGFPRFAADAIHLGDGMSMVTSAHVPYVLDHLSDDSYISLTGKFGTEFFRGMKSLAFDMNQLYVLDVLHPDLREEMKRMAVEIQAESLNRNGDGLDNHRKDLLFIMIEECRRCYGGAYSVERYRICPRSPFADNEVIDLIFRIDPSVLQNLRRGNRLNKALVSRLSPDLAAIPTDKGDIARSRSPLGSLGARYHGASYFLSLVANSRRIPSFLRADRSPLARQAHINYRSWFREELADYIKEILLDERTLRRGLFDPKRVRSVLDAHLNRRRDGSNELIKMVSLELTQRIFLDGGGH